MLFLLLPHVSSIAFGFNRKNTDLKGKIHFGNDILTFLYPCENTSDCSFFSVMLERGRYKFEVWGADGGDTESYSGGKGGYAAAELTLLTSTKFFVHIGGKGQYTKDLMWNIGGYNGGGQGWKDTRENYKYYGAGGGGSTDIRVQANNLYKRIIVAGGGGEGSSRYIGGFGGGLVGENGVFNQEDYDHYKCLITGGNQKSPGMTTANKSNAGFGVGG